jgi:hypothetical protein
MLHEMFELDKDKITPQSNLYTDLDIDSIDAVDIVVKLNQSTGKRISPMCSVPCARCRTWSMCWPRCSTSAPVPTRPPERMKRPALPSVVGAC